MNRNYGIFTDDQRQIIFPDRKCNCRGNDNSCPVTLFSEAIRKTIWLDGDHRGMCNGWKYKYALV